MNKNQLTAVNIAKSVLASLKILPGMTEKDVARWIRKELKKYKATPAFRILIGSGKRTAIPHCYATNKIIRKNELVMVDFGACYQGYRSDVTRTFVMGKPDKRQAMLIKIVSQTQKKAIQAVKAGVLCGTIDKTARDFIKKHCFKHCQVSKKLCPGDCFIHSTGHGIGMKTHQFPRISLKSKTRLKNGMIITIEPGVYVKGWGGVRFEDMVRVTKSGAEILTQSSKVKCQK